MQKYGMIDATGNLVLSDIQYTGYKPVVYAPMPQFDQITQYVYEAPPVDDGDRISVGLLVGTATPSNPMNGPGM